MSEDLGKKNHQRTWSTCHEDSICSYIFFSYETWWFRGSVGSDTTIISRRYIGWFQFQRTTNDGFRNLTMDRGNMDQHGGMRNHWLWGIGIKSVAATWGFVTLLKKDCERWESIIFDIIIFTFFFSKPCLTMFLTFVTYFEPCNSRL